MFSYISPSSSISCRFSITSNGAPLLMAKSINSSFDAGQGASSRYDANSKVQYISVCLSKFGKNDDAVKLLLHQAAKIKKYWDFKKCFFQLYVKNIISLESRAVQEHPH